MKKIKTIISLFFTLLIIGGQCYSQQNTIVPSKPIKSGYAPVNGLKIYYEVYGQGEPPGFNTWFFYDHWHELGTINT